jgi:hypothetical protein
MTSTAKVNAVLPDWMHKAADAANAQLGGERAPPNLWLKKANGDKELSVQLQNLAGRKRQQLLLAPSPLLQKVRKAKPSRLLRFCSNQLLAGALAGVGPGADHIVKVRGVLGAIKQLNEVHSSEELRELADAAWVYGHLSHLAISNKIRAHEEQQQQPGKQQQKRQQKKKQQQQLCPAGQPPHPMP